jgi:arabinogalactan endo-1,4-beta-galactosidase
VKALGKRIKDAGFSFMLDFHYSDTWADPGKQWTPDSWKSLSDTELTNKIYEYTKDCLAQLKTAGATPDFIQTGNEISYGMLWGTEAEAGGTGNNRNRCYTNSSDSNWTRFFNLLKKAALACREECPDAKVILHSERVATPNVLIDFFDRMKSNGIDYDIIGLSYYPYHHGDLATLETALNTLESKDYGKDIMIVEAGYYYAWQPAKKSSTNPDGIEFDYSDTYPITPTGQQAFTKALIELLNNHSKVKGLYWWWMEACENGLDWTTKRVSEGWYNASLFNDNEKVNGKDGITYNYPAGKAMPAIAELKNFLGNPSGIEGVHVQRTSTDDAWYTLDGRKLAGQPTTKGIYIQNGKKKIVR